MCYLIDTSPSSRPSPTRGEGGYFLSLDGRRLRIKVRVETIYLLRRDETLELDLE
jgi:hypothetical protein